MRIDIRRQQIPWMMAGIRAALGPILIAGQARGWNGFTVAFLILTALLSDIFDGVLARRWKCDTAGVRLFDSMADTVFYLCVAAALWARQPQIWHRYEGLLLALFALETAHFAFDFAKFGKPASYHSYLAKLWGLVLASAVMLVFALQRSNLLLPAALVLGILSNLEALLMSAILPFWCKDVKTLLAAWRLRRERLSHAAKLTPTKFGSRTKARAFHSAWINPDL